MSITFFPSIENHKPISRTVKCNFCGPSSRTKLGKSEVCSFCDGEGKYSEMDMPEMNLANTNARAILNLIGAGAEFAGSIKLSDIPEIRRNVLKLLNVKSLREVAVRENVKERNVYSMGIDDQYIVDHLKELDGILVYCQKNHDHFCWG